MTVTYYRDNVVHISSGGVRADGVWYPLETLTYVWHRRTGRLRHGSYMLITRVGAVGLLIALLVAGGIAARRVDLSVSVLVLGILALAVVGTIAGLGVEVLLRAVDRSNERTRGQHEIWIRTAEDEIMIYTTSDRTAFGKVYRAMRRAMEAGTR